MEYRKTWLAIIVTFIAVIPAMIIGKFVSVLYSFLMSRFEGGLLGWITFGWADRIFNSIFPNLVHGFIGGWLAVWLSCKLLKYANYEIVAYSVSTIICAFAFWGFLIGILQRGIGLDTIELISNTVGVIVGLFTMALSYAPPAQLKEPERSAL